MRWWFQRPKVLVKSRTPIDVASLRRLVLEHRHIQDTAYSDQSLDEFLAVACTFTHCSFERLAIRSACFVGGQTGSVYEDCSFDGSQIDCGTPGVATFIRCSFRDTDLANFFGLSISMTDCVFTGTLRKVAFYGVNPESRKRNEFRGNDFRGAQLVDVSFREGIDFTQQHFPPDWVRPEDPYERLRSTVT
jgi:uncharacterized protein YjbI with pentapeptide repeats